MLVDLSLGFLLCSLDLHFCLLTILKSVVCFIQLKSCMSYLYILDNNPLSVVSFANILSHSVSCLFVLLKVYIGVQKLVSLIRTHLFTFAFVSLTSGDRSKKILLRPMSRSTAYIFFQEFHSFISCT